MKYCEYFNIDETYFPCIDDAAIRSGEVPWEKTYPHETFIDMLDCVDKMLGGGSKRSLWIHGSYGTGKSRCAYALKKILDAPEEEVCAYWDKYEALKKKTLLLGKLIGHKKQGVVTAYRYASGSITSTQRLFFAVQESIKEALDKIPLSYKGENTLKENVILWMEDPVHKMMVDNLLKKPEWASEFPQSTADEIISTLKKSTEVSSLMDSIFKMGDREGITVFSLTADSLCRWIKEVVAENHTKIVLIWDEFSGFFRQNRNSLDEFQKIVALCQEIHFYFVIVTHPITSIAGATVSKDDPMSVVQQRYNKVEITLPPNIAFDLIGHAFSVIPAAKGQWDSMTENLDALLVSSKEAVMKSSEVRDPSVMRQMLPIHPMAALVLKNIASAFQSNQRSMFDFIKTPGAVNDRAFQWFIQESGPDSDRPLLTIDMLWNFFYEKGKEHLSVDIRQILDTFPQQTTLSEKEEVVLKTILIMQAVDLRLGGSIPLLKPTEQNLSYAFEGDNPQYEAECKNIAKTLVKKGILISTPVAGGKNAYAVAVFAGDGQKIEDLKEKVLKNSTTSKLAEEGTQLPAALNLPPALKLRYTDDVAGNLPIVTKANFKGKMDELKTKDADWRFYAVLALSKNEEESQEFRTMIKQAAANDEYKNIVVIDALSTPLGLEDLGKYAEYAALAEYYQGKNNQQAADNARRAKDILDQGWKDRIYDGPFIVWTYANHQDGGEKATDAASVHCILQTIVRKRFQYAFDFTKGLSETQLKLTQPKPVSRCGMGDIKIKGLIAGCERSVLGKVWEREKYWKEPSLRDEPLSIIKNAIDEMIRESFSDSGRIAIDAICDFLETQYGFPPCNLSAFIIGFLLKEYRGDPYRFQDSSGHREQMTPDKLSEMIGNCVSQKGSRTTYIVSLTDDEKAFYEMTSEAWGIDPDTCSSPTQAGFLIKSKMRNLVYPVWCLSEVDDSGIFDIVKKYIKLVQSDGQVAHDIANDLGRIARQRPSCSQNLKRLLTADNCREGMNRFLRSFVNGKIVSLAEEIGATNHILSDIKRLFSVEDSALWSKETGEEEIWKLAEEYEVIKVTNILLNVSNSSKELTFASWREKLKFIGISCESICFKKTDLKKIFDLLLRIVRSEEMIPENIRQLLEELTKHNNAMRELLDDTLGTFMDVYAPYLGGFSRNECEDIRNSIQADMFTLSATKSNAEVKKAAEVYRGKQLNAQMYKLWRDKTGGTKNPREWSENHKTPILCCMDEDVYHEAKKAFEVLNRSDQTETEIQSALDFLQQNAAFFEKLEDSAYRDQCFAKSIINGYSGLLPDINHVRSELESLGLDVYDWSDDPRVKRKIENLASAEYNAGGSDEARKVIEEMDDLDKLKDWLKNLVGKDMELGVKIINNRGGLK